MSDFFSRIFAIPSDVSSADEDTNYEEGRRHRKTLTPLSLTDGNAADNTTASSFVENTVSYDQSQFSTDDTDSQEIHRDARQHNTSSSRGRQRRNDTSVGNRSASAEPRSPKKKTQRSSSMALPRNTNVQLKLTTSPKSNRRHRSLSKLGRSSSTSHRRTSSKERLRNTSYSSDDDDNNDRRSSRRSSSAYNNSSMHKRSSSSNTRITDSNNGDRQYSRSKSKSYQPHTNPTTTSPKKKKKKKDSNWSSTKWVKKHLSSPSNTPPKNKDGKKGKTKSSRKEKKKHHHNSSSHNRDTKLSLLPPNQLRPAPVNVGDSIIISQQFLDNADMSVLTMPKDLMSVISTENERNEVEVVQEDEKNHSFDTELQKEVGQLQAYLKDRRIRHQHRSTTNHTTDGRPMHYQTYASRIQEGHVYSYTQDAQEIALGQQHIDDDIPPPPPPPPPRPSPLSRRKTSTSTQNAAIPHWNTPATSNSNSESVASYDDPPGELVTSPTLQQTSMTATTNQQSQHQQQNGHHERSKSDPPGEEYQPFDEVSFLKHNDIRQHASPSSKQPTVDIQPTPNRQQTQSTPNRLNKAVSFSLPPAPISSMKTPPAPPFMGPALDYYYSMERNSNITNTQSPLLPPIIEIWSSVESTSINQNNTSRWNTQKEDELLGEEFSLHVSEDWIDVRDKESDMITEEEAHIDRATSTSLPVDTTASKRQMHSQFVDEDMIDNEFHDILDCGEDCIERTNKTTDDEVPLDEAALDGRHRSTWSTTYKPHTATTMFDEPGYDDLHNSDNWQEVVRQDHMLQYLYKDQREVY